MQDLTDNFYGTLPKLGDFTALAEPANFSPLPADWIVGTADIRDSTGEIARGRYKTVNLIGASVISAMINGLGHRPFPYIFGGDGAAFAVPPGDADLARRTLSVLRRWADQEFDIGLRAACMPVAQIRAAGHDVRVARFAASDGVDYAMFTGGGVHWAESQMKSGIAEVAMAEPGVFPDLTGLSCRWSNLQPRNGRIVSLVIEPTDAVDEARFSAITRQLLDISGELGRAGHPAPVEGPSVRFPPPGLSLEARVSRAGASYRRRLASLFFENLFAWFLFRTGISVGRFDPDQYARAVTQNADFRKFDDGLKMTLDCDESTRQKLQAILDESRAAGLLRYGMFAQDEAQVTCFVPSPMQQDHVHFVDGAGGGYAEAAAQLKS